MQNKLSIFLFPFLNGLMVAREQHFGDAVILPFPFEHLGAGVDLGA